MLEVAVAEVSTHQLAPAAMEAVVADRHHSQLMAQVDRAVELLELLVAAALPELTLEVEVVALDLIILAALAVQE
jgi:hypothetical protein